MHTVKTDQHKQVNDNMQYVKHNVYWGDTHDHYLKSYRVYFRPPYTIQVARHLVPIPCRNPRYTNTCVEKYAAPVDQKQSP